MVMVCVDPPPPTNRVFVPITQHSVCGPGSGDQLMPNPQFPVLSPFATVVTMTPEIRNNPFAEGVKIVVVGIGLVCPVRFTRAMICGFDVPVCAKPVPCSPSHSPIAKKKRCLRTSTPTNCEISCRKHCFSETLGENSVSWPIRRRVPDRWRSICRHVGARPARRFSPGNDLYCVISNTTPQPCVGQLPVPPHVVVP